MIPTREAHGRNCKAKRLDKDQSGFYKVIHVVVNRALILLLGKEWPRQLLDSVPLAWLRSSYFPMQLLSPTSVPQYLLDP